MPLTYPWALTPLHETIEELLTTHQAPVYVVHFTQAAPLERAQALTSINVCTREEKDRIAELIGGFRFSPGFGKTLSRLVKHGIGVHHAGMLPKYRRLVEQLAQAGLLKVICGTDTLGVGINVPIRTVVFTGLTKYDGRRQRMLKAREFHQIAGRAGRAGYDTAGTVVVQAPEHLVENHRLVSEGRRRPEEAQAGAAQEAARGPGHLDRGHLRPAGRRRARGARVADAGQPLDAAQRDRARGRPVRGDAPAAARQPRGAAQPGPAGPAGGRASTARCSPPAWCEPIDPPDDSGRTVRLVDDLQLGFALNQPLSTYALATFDTLDPESPTYALDVVSVLEATLEDPRPVLNAQAYKARGEAVAEMKAEGIEYDERHRAARGGHLAQAAAGAAGAHLRAVPADPPVDLRERAVAEVGGPRHVRAGDVVRGVRRFYGLARSEGLVLRYLGDAYKALRQTVPDA